MGGGNINRSVLTLLGVLSIVALVLGRAARPAETSPSKLCPVDRKDFSFGYWLNGWRKSPQDKSADVLCIESGRFGFMLDVDDLANTRLGLLDDDLDYRQALEAGPKRLGSLPPAKLSATTILPFSKVALTLPSKASLISATRWPSFVFAVMARSI